MKVNGFIVLVALVLVGTRTIAQDQEIFRITPQYSEDKLLEMAINATPPIQSDSLLEPELVDLSTMISNLKYDIRYASTRNFMGMKFYSLEKAFLQRPAADALVRVALNLGLKGIGIVVYDAYRPWYVTKMFWDATPDSLKTYVANPENGSKHNRGSAIDLGLYDLETGEILPMPSSYDEFTERAHSDYNGASKIQKRNRDLLKDVMEAEGFQVYQYEWWHFDFESWDKYPIINLRFEDL